MPFHEDSQYLLNPWGSTPTSFRSCTRCWPHHRRLSNMRTTKKCFLAMSALFLLALLYMMYQTHRTQICRYFRPPLRPSVMCAAVPTSLRNFTDSAKETEYKMRSPAKLLLIPKTSYSSRNVTTLLTANRIKYKSSVAGKNLPDLIKLSKGIGKYGVVFFEDFHSYLNMDKWNRELLDKYCKRFNVGIVAFVNNDSESLAAATLQDSSTGKKLPLTLQSRLKLTNITVNGTSSILRLTKGGQTLTETFQGSEWVTFSTTDPVYSAVAWADRADPERYTDLAGHGITVLQDSGGYDGIPKVLFGGGLRLWLDKLLFLDALSWLSHGRIHVSLTRYILIDIDDIFVGKNRLTVDDVQALIESQRTLREIVPGFTYNLGFSGGFFMKGTAFENLGDAELLRHKDLFWWFPHMWRHLQPHRFDNLTELAEHMRWNKQFAEEHAIPVNNYYSVAPHHSGVYPVHEQLYETWKDVWDIRVTSTEEYPHLWPAHLRRGYVHRGIQVLPRQTCGLYTKNLYYSDYPRGPQVLETSIRGGDLFQGIVYNPVNIFMTHMPNYCADRLAPYAFESVFRMLKCWTNLELKTVEPQKMAEIYFEMFPDDRTPIWGDPCLDKRHIEIWSPNKSCNRLPNFLVIGPQKTGTTALYSFLQQHPAVRSNMKSSETFEELQFFSGPHYEDGIDWYMNYFPERTNGTFLFEKSATYFDKEVVPARAFRLLRHAHLVAILISPSRRAYSWYHHQRAHEDPVALNYSFHEVITANATAPKQLRSLQQRCLEPGKYANHLERWLTFFKSQQLYIVDGEELKYDPISVMNRLQHFLNIEPFIDYSTKLQYNRNKGFYCPVTASNQTKCLGPGKGREYPPMQPDSQRYLKEYYRLYNEALLKLLKRLGYNIPDWLEDDLKAEETPKGP